MLNNCSYHSMVLQATAEKMSPAQRCGVEPGVQVDHMFDFTKKVSPIRTVESIHHMCQVSVHGHVIVM